MSVKIDCCLPKDDVVVTPGPFRRDAENLDAVNSSPEAESMPNFSKKAGRATGAGASCIRMPFVDFHHDADRPTRPSPAFRHTVPPAVFSELLLLLRLQSWKSGVTALSS